MCSFWYEDIFLEYKVDFHYQILYNVLCIGIEGGSGVFVDSNAILNENLKW